jgi:hypothetical protein
VKSELPRQGMTLSNDGTRRTPLLRQLVGFCFGGLVITGGEGIKIEVGATLRGAFELGKDDLL